MDAIEENSNLIPVGTKVKVARYNSFFDGLMGEVKEARCTPEFSEPHYIVAIENGEDFVHRYINRQKFSPDGCHVFRHESLIPLPSNADTTVKRVDPPRC